MFQWWIYLFFALAHGYHWQSQPGKQLPWTNCGESIHTLKLINNSLMTYIGTANDEAKLESIAISPYPLQIGQSFDVYVNISQSKMPTHNT